MGKELDISFPDGTTISGGHPIVLIGPNGAGKSRLGATLAKINNGDRIPALRNLDVGQNIPMTLRSEATREVVRHISNSLNQPWTLAGEINYLMAQLLVEDSESAVTYRDQSVMHPGTKPEETTKMRLVALWHRHFRGRELDLSTYTPTAKSKLGKSDNPYPVQQMSDGERVALYLAARVLIAREGLIVVDEPEVHFHSVLARSFWDDLENVRSDCRFVYITHDLSFAVSRRPAQFALVKSEDSADVLPPHVDIPEDVFKSVLGAASFSVTANRIVFCEGVKGGNADQSFYEAWFNDPDTAVIPVGSCEEVIRSVSVFNSMDEIKGATAIGIIDRDYWPDAYFDGLPEGVTALPVHEIECLFCLPKVFEAVATYQQVSPADIHERYDKFLEKAKAGFHGVVFNKQVLERAKRRVDQKTLALLNEVSTNSDLTEVKTALVGALDTSTWDFNPATMFDEETARLNAALDGPAGDFLKLFPGKTVLGHAADEINIKKNLYVQLLCSALSSPVGTQEGSQLTTLQEQIIEAMKDYLPPRTG